jgi:hypothetical protein
VRRRAAASDTDIKCAAGDDPAAPRIRPRRLSSARRNAICVSVKTSEDIPHGATVCAVERLIPSRFVPATPATARVMRRRLPPRKGGAWEAPQQARRRGVDRPFIDNALATQWIASRTG